MITQQGLQQASASGNGVEEVERAESICGVRLIPHCNIRCILSTYSNLAVRSLRCEQDLKEHEAAVHNLLLCLKYNNGQAQSDHDVKTHCLPTDRTAVGEWEEYFADSEQYNAERSIRMQLG